MALGTAHEHVRVARRLDELPAIDEAFGNGELSYCKVRAVTRVADGDNEARLVAVAKTQTGQELERTCRGMRDAQVATGQNEPERYVRLRTMADGTVAITMRLRADEAELVMKALESSAEESAADAAVDMAETYLARGADKPRHRADRTQVLVHLDADASAARLHDSGHWLSREAFERLSCDCAVSAAKTQKGRVLDVGRSRRTVPPAIGRALLAQDEGCVFPGCDNRRFVDAHHIQHWSRGGETKLDNLCLLCQRHHALVHEGGFGIEHTPEGLRFVRPDGTAIAAQPEPTAAAHEPVELLTMLNPDIAAAPMLAR